MTGPRLIINALYLEPDTDETVRQVTARPDTVDEPLWLHVNVAEEGAALQLAQAAPYMETSMVEALCAEDTRPRVEDFGNEYLVILRGMNMGRGEDPEDMVSLRIWSDGTHIVSAERRPVLAVKKLIDRLKANSKPVPPSEIIIGLAVQMVDHMSDPIARLLEEIDEFELASLGTATADRRKTLIALRERVLHLRRYLVPMKEALAQLVHLGSDWLGAKSTRRLRQANDNLLRHIEDLDAARDQLQFQHEELVAALSDKLNRNMYTLSVVAAIFLPLGFLTGLLGINVGGMPGADAGSAFWWVVGGCAAIVAAQLVYFWRKDWF